MDKQKRYGHLRPEERAVLQIELGRKTSLRKIGALLGRSHTTLSRELARNGVGEPAVAEVVSYQAAQAGQRYTRARQACRRSRKLQAGTALHQVVHDWLLYRRYSPQQIAARLRIEYPDDPSLRVSHETIYAAIYAYPRGALREGLIAQLRQRKSRRGLRRQTASGGPVAVPPAQEISQRPASVETRLLPGHWEGDFIKGAYNRSAGGTLVERTTRFTILCKMDGCTAAAALEGFSRQMKRLPAFLRESLTYDRGSEMACHELLSKQLNIDIWFADAHSPWQRGTNENTNGLLRQFLPKGMDLSSLSQTELNDIARLLNGRPRETPKWSTPEEAVAAETEKFGRAHRAGARSQGGCPRGEILRPWQPGDNPPKPRSAQ